MELDFHSFLVLLFMKIQQEIIINEKDHPFSLVQELAHFYHLCLVNVFD